MSMDEMREMEEISENSNDHSKDIIVNIDQNDIIGSIPFEIYTSNVYNERDSLRIVTTTAANVRNIFNDHSKSLELDKWTPNLPELKSDFFEKFKIYRAIPHGEWQVFLNNQQSIHLFNNCEDLAQHSLSRTRSYKKVQHWRLCELETICRMRPKLQPNLDFNSHMDASAKRDGLSLSDLVHLRMQPVSVGSYNCGQTLSTISVCNSSSTLKTSSSASSLEPLHIDVMEKTTDDSENVYLLKQIIRYPQLSNQTSFEENDFQVEPIADNDDTHKEDDEFYFNDDRRGTLIPDSSLKTP
ncbi:Neurobeachin 2 [Schistosoma japonicum]|uniref:Neurobeachin 2 n=1 Tax=Schistosoma japonicum TaxID=6182 RepID=A0A4Z2DLE6_SCHJA|nr:Neurobeachin 2 [Schistosoma japonicum]